MENAGLLEFFYFKHGGSQNATLGHQAHQRDFKLQKHAVRIIYSSKHDAHADLIIQKPFRYHSNTLGHINR